MTSLTAAIGEVLRTRRRAPCAKSFCTPTAFVSGMGFDLKEGPNTVLPTPSPLPSTP